MSELLSRALDAAGDAVIVIDAEGIIRAWNPCCEKLFGHRATDVIGQEVSVMIPEKLRAGHERGFTAAMESGRLRSDGTVRGTKALRPDGTAVYVQMTFAVVTDDHGKALGSVAVAREWVREPRQPRQPQG